MKNRILTKNKGSLFFLLPKISTISVIWFLITVERKVTYNLNHNPELTDLYIYYCPNFTRYLPGKYFPRFLFWGRGKCSPVPAS